MNRDIQEIPEDQIDAEIGNVLEALEKAEMFLDGSENDPNLTGGSLEESKAEPTDEDIKASNMVAHTSSSDEDEFEDAVDTHQPLVITRTTKSRPSNIPDEAIMFK